MVFTLVLAVALLWIAEPAQATGSQYDASSNIIATTDPGSTNAGSGDGDSSETKKPDVIYDPQDDFKPPPHPTSDEETVDGYSAEEDDKAEGPADAYFVKNDASTTTPAD